MHTDSHPTPAPESPTLSAESGAPAAESAAESAAEYATGEVLPPPTKGRGHGLLREWLTTAGLSQGALARLVGVTRPAVSQWVAGTSRPHGPTVWALEAAAGIPAIAWLDDSELAAARVLAVKLRATAAALSTAPSGVIVD